MSVTEDNDQAAVLNDSDSTTPRNSHENSDQDTPNDGNSGHASNSNKRRRVNSEDENISLMQLKMNLNDDLQKKILKRLDEVEARAKQNTENIRGLTQYGMRKNVMFNGVFTKENVESEDYDLRAKVINFINNNMNDPKKRRELVTSIDIDDVHPTKSTVGPFVQVIVCFRTHEIAKEVVRGANFCKSINHRRVTDMDTLNSKSGQNRRAIQIRISWQLEKTANSMMSYLSEIRRRYLDQHPNTNKTSIQTYKKPKEMNPIIKFKTHEYTVYNLPDELKNLMNEPWKENWVRGSYGRQPRKAARTTKPNHDGSGTSGSHRKGSGASGTHRKGSGASGSHRE